VGSKPTSGAMGKKEEILVQCNLQHRLNGGGYARMVANLPYREDLKVGVYVTLKDSENPKQWWQVCYVGQPVAKNRINRLWNNNI
jgi:hypothetical protein